MTFSLATPNFKLGVAPNVFPFEKIRVVPLLIKVALDFESTPTHTMVVSATVHTFVTSLTGQLTLVVKVLDNNEPPVLRVVGTPSAVVRIKKLS